MKLARQFVGRKKRMEKADQMVEKHKPQCQLCGGYNQTIRSMVLWEGDTDGFDAVIQCNNCGNVYSKEFED